MELGRITGAKLISLNRLRDRAGTLLKDKAVIAVCRSGNRSVFVARKLSEEGYEAASVEGGARAWVSEGLPFKGRVA